MYTWCDMIEYIIVSTKFTNNLIFLNNTVSYVYIDEMDSKATLSNSFAATNNIAVSQLPAGEIPPPLSAEIIPIQLPGQASNTQPMVPPNNVTSTNATAVTTTMCSLSSSNISTSEMEAPATKAKSNITTTMKCEVTSPAASSVFALPTPTASLGGSLINPIHLPQVRNKVELNTSCIELQASVAAMAPFGSPSYGVIYDQSGTMVPLSQMGVPTMARVIYPSGAMNGMPVTGSIASRPVVQSSCQTFATNNNLMNPKQNYQVVGRSCPLPGRYAIGSP